MFKFIHSSDIHLDSPLRGLELPEDAPQDQIHTATRQALDNMVDLAIREKVSFVLVAGDVYDGDWRDFNTGLFFNQRMAQLRDANIRVFIVSGNHDAASQISKSLRLPDNVHVFPTRKPDSFVIDDLNVVIHGQSFATRSVMENLSSNYPHAKSGYFNIGLLHTALSGHAGHEPYAPCSADELRAKGYQYWALGHVHHREEVLSDPWIIFPGNIQGRHIRETGVKGCTVVTVEENQVSQVEHVALDVLRWNLCRVDVKGCANTDEVYERVQKAFETILTESDGRPVMVRLELQGTTAAHQKLRAQSVYWTEEFRGLGANLGGAGIWLEKVRLKTREQIDPETLMQGDTPIGMLLANLRDIAIDVEKLPELDPEMTTFLNKLPAELRGGEDPFDPTDPIQWGEIVSDVKDLLIARLLTAEGQGK
jgi:DNA repair exonuclease SbcCD nuclease subunit